MTIRNATPRDHFIKAATIDVSHFEEWDVRHIDEKFPQLKGVSPFLLLRLGRANTRRRQLFKYLEKHQSKIALNLLPTVRLDKTTVPASKKPSIGPRTVASGPSTLATTVNTQTTIATFLEDYGQAEEPKFDDSLSETSSAASEDVGAESTLQVPSPPQDSSDGKPFECPYCFEILRVSSTLSWRQVSCQNLDTEH